MKFITLFFLMLGTFSLTFLSSCGDEEEVAMEICDNNMDDDGDGFLDCDDSDCTDEIICQASDRRVKEAIEPLHYGLETLLELEPYSFKYKGTETTHLGLMAQDLQGLIPEIVIDDPSSDEDIMAIRYQELIPVLIRAIQQQQIIIDELIAEKNTTADMGQ